LKVDFSQLKWPKGLNLDKLQDYLPEQKIKKIIIENLDKPREKRRIMLPSRKCAKKVLAHYLLSRANAEDISLDKIIAKYRRLLKNLKLDRMELKRLYRQRQSEIVKEELF